MSKGNPKLAKLILHFNTPSLTNQLCKMVPGAIVIDNGSTRFPYNGTNRCIRQDNFGFTKGWNEAIKTLYDEFDAFWLMNSDIQISPVSIKRVEQIVSHHQEVKFFTPSYNCWMKHCQPGNGSGMAETGVIEFTAPIIRKEVFEQIGFFDELFSRGYGVEFDYCYKARKAGIKMYVDFNSKFYHLGQQTISKHEGLISYSAKANFELTHGLITRYGENYMGIVFKGITIKTDFNMRIAVYVTIFGDYDQVKEIPKQEVKADYFIVTDNRNLKADGWKTIVPNFPRKDLHARLRAKYFKLFPWECEELSKYEISIYIDASIRITSANFIATCIKNLTTDLLFFKHPQRNCIYQEGKASVGLIKYKEEPIEEQLTFYRKFHPANGGLYAGGVIVRKHTDLVKKIMTQWWFENIKYSYQDQLSLPVILQANGVIPSTFKENQYNNSFLRVEWHDDVVHGKSRSEYLTDGLDGNRNMQASVSDVGLITVLMPVWKTPIDLLKRAVESILKQTDDRFELLIVDDHNTDIELIRTLYSYLRFNKVRIIHTTQNEGLAKTLDFGIAAANGELIVRMDSDDVAHETLIQTHRLFFTEHRDAAICGVQLNLMYNDGRKKGVTAHAPIIDLKKAVDNRGYWIVNHPGICYRKKIVEQLGGYGNTSREFAEDYVLWCKFIKAGYLIYNLPDVLIDYTLGDGQQIGQDRGGKEWLAFLEQQKSELKLSTVK